MIQIRLLVIKEFGESLDIIDMFECNSCNTQWEVW